MLFLLRISESNLLLNKFKLVVFIPAYAVCSSISKLYCQIWGSLAGNHRGTMWRKIMPEVSNGGYCEQLLNWSKNNYLHINKTLKLPSYAGKVVCNMYRKLVGLGPSNSGLCRWEHILFFTKIPNHCVTCVTLNIFFFFYNSIHTLLCIRTYILRIFEF